MVIRIRSDLFDREQTFRSAMFSADELLLLIGFWMCPVWRLLQFLFYGLWGESGVFDLTDGVEKVVGVWGAFLGKVLVLNGPSEYPGRWGER